MYARMKAAFRAFNVIVSSTSRYFVESELVFRIVASKMLAILPQINEITYHCTWYDIVIVNSEFGNLDIFRNVRFSFTFGFVDL